MYWNTGAWLWITIASSLKKTKVKLDPLNHIDIRLIVENGIKRRICHSICRYANIEFKRLIEILNSLPLQIALKK